MVNNSVGFVTLWTRVSFETSFDSKQPKVEPKLVSALSETKRLFRLFRFYTETEGFDVSIEPKQTEDQPKQIKREYRVAAINLEFSLCFFNMAHHSWKPYDFIQLNTGWQRNILRINSYNKTAVSSDDSLDPGPDPPAGLRHGVPGEGPHHLPDLRDQSLGLVIKLSSDPQFRDAPRKIV